MPIIKPCADLRNNYNEISKLCHKTNNPIFITQNGHNDLVILSNEAFENFVETKEKEIEKLIDKKFNERFSDFESFRRDKIKKIKQSLKDMESGNCKSFEDFCQEIEAKYNLD